MKKYNVRRKIRVMFLRISKNMIFLPNTLVLSTLFAFGMWLFMLVFH